MNERLLHNADRIDKATTSKELNSILESIYTETNDPRIAWFIDSYKNPFLDTGEYTNIGWKKNEIEGNNLCLHEIRTRKAAYYDRVFTAVIDMLLGHENSNFRANIRNTKMVLAARSLLAKVRN